MKVGRWVIKRIKVFVVALLMTTLVGSGLGTSVSAAASQTPSDIQGHWAEQTLERWQQAGLIKGNTNGKLEPNRLLTRAEWMALTNRVFGYTEKADVAFSDLSTANWAYEDVREAVHAGYIAGYEDGTIRAGHEVSRQEAAVMLARILKLDTAESSTAASAFKDAASLASWSQGAVDALVQLHLLSGYTDGTFKPQAFITRAEAVVMLDKAKAMPSSSSSGPTSTATTYNQAGTYGSIIEKTTIQGDVLIQAAGVTLQNISITGKLTLAAGIGDGDVTLKQVTVQGETLVQGGGPNSIHLTDTTFSALLVNKPTGIVRIVAEGTTSVGTVELRSSAILEEATGLTGPGFSKAKLGDALPANAAITLTGSFDTLDITSSPTVSVLIQGTINQLTVGSPSQGLTLTIGTGAVINSLILHAKVKVIGQGTIQQATVSPEAQGTTFEKQPLQVNGTSTNVSSGSGSSNGPGTVQFYALTDAAVPQLLKDYGAYLWDNALINHSLNFKPSVLAVAANGVVSAVDLQNKLWVGTGTRLERFDVYQGKASDASTVQSYPEGTYFKGEVKALLLDGTSMWVLTQAGVSRIQY